MTRARPLPRPTRARILPALALVLLVPTVAATPVGWAVGLVAGETPGPETTVFAGCHVETASLTASPPWPWNEGATCRAQGHFTQGNPYWTLLVSACADAEDASSCTPFTGSAAATARDTWFSTTWTYHFQGGVITDVEQSGHGILERNGAVELELVARPTYVPGTTWGVRTGPEGTVHAWLADCC